MQRPAVMFASGALLIGGLAGCGTKLTPAQQRVELTAGFANFVNYKNISVTFHFSDPQGNLAKALKKDTTDAGEKAIIDRVLAGAIKITATHTTGYKRDVRLELDEGSTTDFAVTTVGDDLYLHIDKGFLTQAGGKNAIDAISQFAPALATGGTLRISGLRNTLEGSGLGGIVPAPTPTASINPKAVEKALFGGIGSAITITSVKGHTYSINADVKALANAFLSAVQPFLKDLPDIAKGSVDNFKTEIDKVPTGTVSGTVTTKGHAVSEVALDLESVVNYAKAADPANAKDAPDLTGGQLLATFDTSAPAVTAPSGATNFDIANLIKQFLSGPIGNALKGGQA